MAAKESEPPLWALLVQLLPERDERAEWYSPADVAALVGLSSRGVMKHCRALWPKWEGQYRLTKNQAELLLRRICNGGRKLPSRESVLARIQERNQ